MNRTAQLIANYTSALPCETSAQVAPFVRSTVTAAYGHAFSVRATQQALSAMAGFADWLVHTGAGDLDASSLRADLIDAYTAFRMHEVRGAVAERERKLLRTLGGIPNTVEKRDVSTSADSTAPYTHDEQGSIRRWAQAQPLPHRQPLALAVTALGLGCGLTLSEMTQVRTDDVHLLPDGLAGVRIGKRVVPALASWAEELEQVANAGKAGSYLVRPNASARTFRGLHSALDRFDPPAPSTQRMRATWLHAHVEAGTRVDVLIAAAGLKSSDMLRRILPHVRPVPEAMRVQALRLNEGVAR